MKREISHINSYGEGYSTQTGKKKKKKSKVKSSEKESKRYYYYYILLILIFRGPELTQHFSQNAKNLALPEQDRFQFISYPTYVWWNKDRKETIHRFLGNFYSPVQYMEALFHIDVIAHICEKTPVFLLGNKKRKLTPTDFYKFLGLELMRGYIGITNIEHMWSEGEIQILYPGKEEQLSKNYWFAISNGLDFDTDFVHTALITLFQLYLVPGYHVTVDEIRIPCHHEGCPFKNHNRDKPDIWAIESKSLHADNGYLLDFINPCQEKVPTPHDSVMLFTNYLKSTERAHHIVADSNFLSALDLLELWDKGFEATISCKRNRPSFIWQDGLAKDLPKGYSRVASSERICCVCTHNQGKPKIATTLCYAIEDKDRADVKDRRDVLKIYDEHKGKADQFGHLFKSGYPMGHHQNWQTSLLIGWFYFSLTNAYILYSMRNTSLTHKEYVYEIAKKFIVK